jgi:hypothetical protein
MYIHRLLTHPGLLLTRNWRSFSLLNIALTRRKKVFDRLPTKTDSMVEKLSLGTEILSETDFFVRTYHHHFLGGLLPPHEHSSKVHATLNCKQKHFILRHWPTLPF